MVRAFACGFHGGKPSYAGICYPANKMAYAPDRMFRLASITLLICVGITAVDTVAHQQSPVPAKPPASSNAITNADFAAAADEVLGQMSDITGLKLMSPLRKSLRTREQIRAYVIKEMDEDKDADERYAGERSAEAFGLLPKGFDLDSLMVDLLTEQIAGLYDPKTHEFYVADWIPIDDQKMVMAHELTHALEDQHFQIEKWSKAARPNDDAELAREAVLEGSAMAAMVDYLMASTGRSLQDLPDINPAMLLGDMESTPTLAKAPPFLKDALIFPYLDGLTFSAAALKGAGWSNLPVLFTKPPVSTQQIMHPELYRAGKPAPVVTLPAMDKSIGPGWKKLEDNIMGEFGWKEVLKQFLGENKATPLSAAWDGDRYQVFEQTQPGDQRQDNEQKGGQQQAGGQKAASRKGGKLLLIARLRLANEEQSRQFLAAYTLALGKKHSKRSDEVKQPDFYRFATADGGVFLRCVARDCVTLEGGDPALFAALTKELGWAPPTETARTLRPRVAHAGH
jgi:hypothetical protein